jgi:hypothetical protein
MAPVSAEDSGWIALATVPVAADEVCVPSAAALRGWRLDAIAPDGRITAVSPNDALYAS